MADDRGTYRPNYAVPPGQVLAEMLGARELSQAQFAKRCGRSPKLISEIIGGIAPVEPETAIQFERVLGMDAQVWLNIEAQYQLFRAKKQETKRLNEAVQWASKFPIAELVAVGAIAKPNNATNAARELLAFFGVGTTAAWSERYGRLAVSYRHSPSFRSSPESIAAWLRIGEVQADTAECANYDRAHFVDALKQIRKLTVHDPEKFLPALRKLCAQSGVVLALVPPLPKLALSGAARWLSPRRALIQQTLRHKTNDHFWFTFFHEAAHILLHSKKDVFVDTERGDGTKAENEANEWACNCLIPSSELKDFVVRGDFSKSSIVRFARQLGIAPAIVVGRLQHDRHVHWSRHNNLKARYEWTEE